MGLFRQGHPFKLCTEEDSDHFEWVATAGLGPWLTPVDLVSVALWTVVGTRKDDDAEARTSRRGEVSLAGRLLYALVE